MKLFVTGGMGFIGSNFIRYILDKYPKYEIVNIDSLTYAANPDTLKDLEDNPRYKHIAADITEELVMNAYMEDCDAVVHFAAESHVDNSIKGSKDFIKTNITGTHVLLECARKLGIRFHHVSTDEVYGHLGKTGKFKETTPYNPRSPYSASKASSDHLVRAYYHTYGLPITITNCSNNYGAYQHIEKLIPKFITNLIKGDEVTVYGKGQNIRDWIHVLDHCRAIDLVLHKGKIGETYLVGGDCELNNMEITMEILNEMGMGEEMIHFVEDRAGHDFRYAIDHSKITNELGWKPEYDFKGGLKSTIDWYKENRHWWDLE